MKRFIPLLLALLLVAGGCGQSGQKAAEPAPSQPQTPAPAPTQARPQVAAKPAIPAHPSPSKFTETEQAKKVMALATSKNPDKVKELVAGAKANNETTLTLYTSMNVKMAETLKAAFEKWAQEKHGLNVKINLWRGGSEQVMQRIDTEAKANRFDVDVVESNGPELEQLGRVGLTSLFSLPSMQDYPDAARDPRGLWHATRFNFFVPMYNTKLVKPEELPKTYQDLLDPKWKGRLAVEAEDWDWMATLVKSGPFGGEAKALEYFKGLKAQNTETRKGHTLLADLVAAGEVPFALTSYNYIAQQLKDKGAPVEWLPLEPVVARANGIALPINAPHPHLALLLVEYALSVDGQTQLASQGIVPANPKVETNPPRLNKGFQYKMADIAAVIDEAKKWEQIWNDTFIKK